MLVSVFAFGWSGVAASHVVPCPPTTTKVDRFAVNGTDWIACEDLKVRKKEKRDESLSETTSFSFSPFFFNIHISIRYTAVRLCLCRRLLKKTRSGSQKGKGGPSPNTEHTNTSTTEYNKLHACPPALAAQMASARPEHPAC